ncbi:hypothetical protein E2C01_058812 [Portunus trituberculatus]|uniref:Uncharacterized protein n=1 Tax=Portunus trituberculatus TaxID=210409 RepID=A0A5B7H0U4_PORTR|nr:hypothetical protein [Portunus trituberculatus]
MLQYEAGEGKQIRATVSFNLPRSVASLPLSFSVSSYFLVRCFLPRSQTAQRPVTYNFTYCLLLVKESSGNYHGMIGGNKKAWYVHRDCHE